MAESTTCTNDNCEIITQSKQCVEYIIRMNIPESSEEREYISLQEIVTKHEEKELKETGICGKCNAETMVEREILKAPDTLLVQVNRRTESGKNNLPITCKDGEVKVKEKGVLTRYKVKGVIAHKGEEGESGHYVCNILGNAKMGNKWYQIDDAEIKSEVIARKTNQEGTIFMMRKIKQKNTEYRPQSTTDQRTYADKMKTNIIHHDLVRMNENRPKTYMTNVMYTPYQYQNNQGRAVREAYPNWNYQQRQNQQYRYSSPYSSQPKSRDTKDIPCKYFKNGTCRYGGINMPV